MIDWTDRHCRYFHRLLSQHALLYSEMIVAEAILHGDREKLLADQTAGPVGLQIGGSDPDKIARAIELAAPYHYSEINLNVGCPSDRVQSGTFGACLMRTPELVGECVKAMKSATDLPVTVKCRIGIDDQNTGPALDNLAHLVWESGCDGLWVHGRKAWLQGLSPKENREIPPLDYPRVHQLKRENPTHFIGLNGGIDNLIHAKALVEDAENVIDGVMLGRAAYQTPGLLRQVDQLFYGSSNPSIKMDDLIDAMICYAQNHKNAGGKLHHVTRHMVGLFHGKAGARRWRQILSTEATRHDAGTDVLLRAYESVKDEAAKLVA